jgi:signal transduction histidine kinase
LGNKSGLSDTYNNIGAIYKIEGNYPKALEYFQKSLTIEKELNNTAGIAGSYSNIGVVYDIQENYPNALKYYLKALEYFQKTNDIMGISDTYHNIGINYFSQRMYSKALEYFQKSLDIYKKTKNNSGIAWSYFNIGKTYRVQENYDKAKEYLQKSLKLSVEIENKSIEANNYKELSLLYLSLNKPKKANIYAKKAYLIADIIGDKELLKNTTKILATSFAKLGLYKDAYNYHVKYKNLNDSIFNKNNVRKLAKIEYQYKYEKEKEAERLNQKKKEEILAKELKFQRTLKYILITGLLVAFLIILLFVKLYREKKKANDLLIQKNNEILEQQELISKQNVEIKKRSDELLQHKNHLEEIVQKRTADLVKAKEKAEESDRLKTAFLNNVSHEFRTPMNGIIGFSSFLTEPNLSPDIQEEYAGLINQSCKQLLHIVNDTVEISKVHSHQTEVTKSIVNVVDTINNIINSFSDFVEQKSLEIRFHNTISRADAEIITDDYKFERIVWHLIDNAIKFSYSGQIVITLKKDEHNRLFFQVEDSGIGIPTNLQEKVFDPYHQVETGTAKRFGGVGVGLSLTKAYIKLLGGDISLKSEQNKGTSVSFTIPIEATQPKNPNDDKKPTGNINKKTILIAEDNDLNYLLLESILSRFETTLLHAWNGKEALEILNREPAVDVILMDLKMPVMDGYEAVAEIKRKFPGIPVVAQTAYTVHADLKELNKINFDGYVTKPIKISNLINVLKQVLKG